MTILGIGLLGIGISFIMIVVLAVIFAGDESNTEISDDLLELQDMSNPAVMALTLLIVIILAVPVLVGVKLAKTRPVGSLFSIAGGFRWPVLWRAITVGCLVLIPLNCMVALANNDAQFHIDGNALLLLAVIIALVPAQVLAEELVFRSYLGQLVGRWVKSPVFPILAPVPLFVAGHIYDAAGLLAIGVFAVSAGVITWYTGGIEATTGLHLVNNLTVFTFGAVGLADINSEAPGWTVAVLVIIADTVMAALVILDYRHRNFSFAPPTARVV